MVLGNGLRKTVAGIILGMVASFGLTRFLSGQIWGVSATNPLTFGSVASVVLVVGVLACLLPALRATKVDPSVALRQD